MVYTTDNLPRKRRYFLTHLSSFEEKQYLAEQGYDNSVMDIVARPQQKGRKCVPYNVIKHFYDKGQFRDFLTITKLKRDFGGRFHVDMIPTIAKVYGRDVRVFRHMIKLFIEMGMCKYSKKGKFIVLNSWYHFARGVESHIYTEVALAEDCLDNISNFKAFCRTVILAKQVDGYKTACVARDIRDQQCELERTEEYKKLNRKDKTKAKNEIKETIRNTAYQIKNRNLLDGQYGCSFFVATEKSIATISRYRRGCAKHGYMEHKRIKETFLLDGVPIIGSYDYVIQAKRLLCYNESNHVRIERIGNVLCKEGGYLYRLVEDAPSYFKSKIKFKSARIKPALHHIKHAKDITKLSIMRYEWKMGRLDR